MKILFFDDDELRHVQFKRLVKHNYHAEFFYAYDVKQAKKMLSEQYFSVVSLDHDMSGQIYQPSGEGTGYEVAEFIATLDTKPNIAIVHSFNEKGAPLMVDVLQKAKINTEWIPFNCADYKNALEEASRL
jgi:hypothetical protein